MFSNVNGTLLSQFLGFYCLSKLLLSIQAYNMVKSRCFLHIIFIQDCFNPESFSVTSVHVKSGKSYIINIVSRLLLSLQAYSMVKSRCFLHIIII